MTVQSLVSLLNFRLFFSVRPGAYWPPPPVRGFIPDRCLHDLSSNVTLQMRIFMLMLDVLVGFLNIPAASLRLVWFSNKSLWQKIFRSWFALVWSDSDMRGGRVFRSRILCCCSVQTLFWLFTAHPIVQWAFSPAVLTGGSSCLWGKNGQTCRGHTGDP